MESSRESKTQVVCFCQIKAGIIVNIGVPDGQSQGGAKDSFPHRLLSFLLKYRIYIFVLSCFIFLVPPHSSMPFLLCYCYSPQGSRGPLPPLPPRPPHQVPLWSYEETDINDCITTIGVPDGGAGGATAPPGRNSNSLGGKALRRNQRGISP